MQYCLKLVESTFHKVGVVPEKNLITSMYMIYFLGTAFYWRVLP